MEINKLNNSIFSEEKIHEILESLEAYRENFNGDHFGYGFDRYKRDEAFYYAEAYALWGQGYVINYKTSGKQIFLEKALRCAEWLINNTQPGYINLCWGLPWQWEQWNAPAELGYLITTVFVGDFFLDLYAATNIKQWLETAIQIASWIEHENGGEDRPDGYFYYYANSPELRFFIPNPSAKAAGFLYRLYNITQETHFFEKARQAIMPIINFQSRNGGWDYSEFSAVRDITHNGFILDGLYQSYIFSNEEVYKKSLIKGFNFFEKNLFFQNGAMLGRSCYRLDDLRKVSFYSFAWDQLKRMIPLPKKYYAPLWGYASALRIFSEASQIQNKYMNTAKIICLWVIKNLGNQDGSFSYDLVEKSVYIRHQAHIYQAISCFNYQISKLEK